MLRLDNRDQIDEIWRENNVRAYKYLVRCDSTVSISAYLPGDVEPTPTAQPDVFRLRRTKSSSLTPTRPPDH
jgi:hypothetical protein